MEKLGTIGERISASLLDYLIITVLAIPCMFALSLILQKNIEVYARQESYEEAYKLIGILAWLITDFFYTVILQASIKQSTFGQLAVGIKLVKFDGTKATLSDVIFRVVVSYFSSILLKGGYLLALFNKNQQTLHDLVANTVVIKLPSSLEKENIKVSQSIIDAIKNNSRLIVILILVLVGLIVLWSGFSKKQFEPFLNAPNKTVLQSEWIYLGKDKIQTSKYEIFYDSANIKKISKGIYLVSIAYIFEKPINFAGFIGNEQIDKVRQVKYLYEVDCKDFKVRRVKSDLYSTILSDSSQIRLNAQTRVENDNFKSSTWAQNICSSR
jgi:uncharacterized RDD family membrane protein YckC